MPKVKMRPLLRIKKFGQMTRQGTCLACGQEFESLEASTREAEDGIKALFDKHDCVLGRRVTNSSSGLPTGEDAI